MIIRPFVFLSAVIFAFTGSEAKASALTPTICQNKKCYPATMALTRERLFEQIQNLVDNNLNQNMSLCEANPQSKMCLTKGFSIPLYSGITQMNMDVASARILDKKEIEKTTGLDLIIDYKVKTENLFPTCQTAPSRLGVLEANRVQLIAPEFSCNFSQSNKSSFSIAFDVDYINFDNGTVGAYYSMAASKALAGQKNGYVLFRFPQTDSSALNNEFPMPSVYLAYQQQIQQPHTQMQPVWMKPSPILNTDGQEVVVTPSQNQAPRAQAALPKAPDGTPSTTGLILQDKVILPPLEGIRKTVTVKKQIIQEGKPVVYEEEVKHYVQANENAPLIEESQAIAIQKANTPAVPEMPKPNNQLIQTSYYDQMPEYIFPQEVMLTIDEAKVPQPPTDLTNEQMPSVQEKLAAIEQESNQTDKKTSSSIWDKIEKLFYF